MPLFLLFCFALANAQAYNITTNSIELKVDEQGYAEVTEKLFLSFPNEYHLQLFRAEIEKIGVDLDAWREFDAEFSPSIGTGETVLVSDISFVEAESKYLEMKYSFNEPVMTKKSETSRAVEFSLNEKFFGNFLEGSLWVIPGNVTIIVDMPVQAEIKDAVKPEANVSGNRVVWTGYKSTNVLALNYVVFRQISTFTLNDLAETLANSEFFPYIAAAAALLALIVLWKRKAIAGRIETYVIEHSDLSNMEEDD